MSKKYYFLDIKYYDFNYFFSYFFLKGYLRFQTYVCTSILTASLYNKKKTLVIQVKQSSNPETLEHLNRMNNFPILKVVTQLIL